MKNKNSTKKALVTSIVSTCASVTMLAGATFAWFTDTASTGVNKIQAGTLDIGLYNAEGTTSVEGKTLNWKTADGAKNEILWEPGATYELETVKVVNEGDLALKYKVLITGINGDADLNEAIEWEINGANIDEEYKLAADTSKEITISGTMKRTAGNKYQGKSIEDIAITVVATQDTVEKDSYDNQYDKNAAYNEYTVVTNTKEIQDAVKAGKDVIFDSDIAVEKEELVPGYGQNKTGLAQTNGGVIDGNGKKLSVNGANKTWDCAIYTTGGTIKDLTIDGGFRGIMTGGLKSDLVIDNVVIDNSGYTIHADGDTRSEYSLTVNNSTLNGWTSFSAIFESVTFKNCTFGKGHYYNQYPYDSYARPYQATTFENCEFVEDFYFDASKTNGIVFVNCTVNGQELTQENLTTLLTDKAANATVK